LEPARIYLKKHSAGDSLIQSAPEKGLKYIVVIPAYIETRLEESLVSLFNAVAPENPIEVLVIVNWPDTETPENIKLSHEIFLSAKNWSEQHSSENKRFHIAESGNIPRKKAGVGYARKTGMDEAVRRFLGAGQKDGIIISFDADSKCETDFFTAIEEHFLLNPSADGCSIYFEHPLEGMDFNPEVYRAIMQYELHMRCYLHGVRYSGFPNAFYTVGSSLAVRAPSYCRQGGMNIRQAGEDFYFLQKFFDLGNFSDLLKTTVHPSPRPSLRVPFGTGKAVDTILKSEESLKSYNPEIYHILKEFFAKVPGLYQRISISGIPESLPVHSCLNEYLDDCGFWNELLDIYENSGSVSAFTKRFYRYFNMFRILKFAKHARKTFPDLPVIDCARVIMQKTDMNPNPAAGESELLLEFRRKDKGF
jgi:hypothetical protein